MKCLEDQSQEVLPVTNYDFPTELVFGEAKSFGGENRRQGNAIKDSFGDIDIERMRKLAIRFPGSILVFATMKRGEEFSSDELARLSHLAEWGREPISERHQSRAPVIILTGTELFAPHSLHATWEEVGGRHGELAGHRSISNESLRTLADLTQQLYLNMPSYDSWIEDKHRKQCALKEAPGTPPVQ